MALHYGGFLFGVLLIAFHGVSADDVIASGATPVIEQATCESRLEKVKSELQKVSQVSLIDLDPFDSSTSSANPQAPSPADAGVAHWPASRTKYVPPLVEFFHEGFAWLKSTDQQVAVAGAAGVFGLLNVVNGPHSFKIVLMVGLALLAAASAQYEAKLVWPGIATQQQLFVAAYAGLLTARMAYDSIQGAVTIVGFLFGLGISALLEPFFDTSIWSLNASVVWYSVWALVGILSFTCFQKYTLAFVMPTLGGFLLSSCLGYFIMVVFQQQPHSSQPPWMVIQGNCWLDFAGALVGGGAPAGIFGTLKTPGFDLASSIEPDRVLGRLLWFLFFYVGMKRQWNLGNRDQYQYMNKSMREPLV